jgi:para-nitrobenzyl esterase
VIHNGSIQGVVVNGVSEYLGIPYARPPVGRFRWTPPPRRFGRYSGVLNATQFSNVCPQFNALVGTQIGDENCLFLNVYVPNGLSSSETRLPVMVWIHRGGLTGGAGSFYDPTPLVQRGVIVVTINYRLGLLGFFAQTALDAETPPVANYGFMDQQFALKWVRANIAAFGGDRRRVTIFGESAGGQSVYAQLASPLAAGLFEGAIAESGAYASFPDYLEAIIPIAQSETTGSFFEMSGAAFATNVSCASQTAACLRAVPAATLIAAQPFPMYPFVDGKLLTQTPAAAFASGHFNQVPVISGTNHDEYRLFVAELYDYVGNPVTNANYTTAVNTL